MARKHIANKARVTLRVKLQNPEQAQSLCSQRNVAAPYGRGLKGERTLNITAFYSFSEGETQLLFHLMPQNLFSDACWVFKSQK